jgi:hypothetical protein
MMTENRFRRRRPGVSAVGGPGNWHYEAESRFIKMREYTRAMIRDHAAAKFLIERACDNIFGRGFRYEPNTGDDGLDLELFNRSRPRDSQACDVGGK